MAKKTAPKKAPAKKTAAKKTARKPRSFEQTLWDTADKLRGSVESSEYKHVVLSLIFLKFVSDKFEARKAEIIAAGQEKYVDMVAFYAAKNVFYLPEASRWSFIEQHAKQDDIALKIDTALHTIEKNNKALRGALPDNYFSRLGLDGSKLAALIDCINNIDTVVQSDTAVQSDAAVQSDGVTNSDTGANSEEDVIGRVLRVLSRPLRRHGGQGRRPQPSLIAGVHQPIALAIESQPPRLDWHGRVCRRGKRCGARRRAAALQRPSRAAPTVADRAQIRADSR